MTRPPEDFPLPPLDRKGDQLKEGDKVKVLLIPEWLIHDLDDESIKAVKACEGTIMMIEEFDSNGYAWMNTVTKSTDTEYECHDFCIEPENLLLL